MRKNNLRANLSLFMLSAVVYILLDLPVRATGFLSFGVFIGLKNFLPAVLGLLFGWCGTLGCIIGCVFTAVLSNAALNEILYESVCIAVYGIGMWLLWYSGKKPYKVHLKTARDYMKYTLISLVLSAICGSFGFLFMSENVFLAVLIAYFSMSLLVGIPVIIIMSSVMCVIPVAPPYYHIEPDLTDRIDSATDSIAIFNDKLEEYAMEKNISYTNLFGIQNCIEEVIIRIHERCPSAIIEVFFYYDDSTSLWFTYTGEKYNPFLAEKNEEAETMLGLQLIKHRALRASHRYSAGSNRIHIVI